MKAKTITGKSPAEIQAAIDESKLDQFEPTLAIITLTNIENTEALRSIFAQRINYFIKTRFKGIKKTKCCCFTISKKRSQHWFLFRHRSRGVNN